MEKQKFHEGINSEDLISGGGHDSAALYHDRLVDREDVDYWVEVIGDRLKDRRLEHKILKIRTGNWWKFGNIRSRIMKAYYSCIGYEMSDVNLSGKYFKKTLR